VRVDERPLVDRDVKLWWGLPVCPAEAVLPSVQHMPADPRGDTRFALQKHTRAELAADTRSRATSETDAPPARPFCCASFCCSVSAAVSPKALIFFFTLSPQKSQFFPFLDYLRSYIG